MRHPHGTDSQFGIDSHCNYRVIVVKKQAKTTIEQ
jgi:hypothetical protein